jgi:two-component system, NtrC family, nitrogen regulation sensor histidine kinase NtrY
MKNPAMTTADTSADLVVAPASERRQRSLIRAVAPIAVLLALLSAGATFAILLGLTSIQPTPQVVQALYGVDAATTVLLLGIIARELWLVVQARRRGEAAAKLHVRTVWLFSVIALVPAIGFAGTALFSLSQGFGTMFDLAVRATVATTGKVGEVYMRDATDKVANDAVSLVVQISRARDLYTTDRAKFHETLTTLARERALPTALLIDNNSQVIETTESDPAARNFPLPPKEVLANVNDTQPLISPLLANNVVVALIRVRGMENTFLYVVRAIDPQIADSFRQAKTIIDELQFVTLNMMRSIGLTFGLICLAILMSSVLFGLRYADQLVTPINRLMEATNKVSKGDLHVQVPIVKSEGDLAKLGETFNEMIGELRTQRDDLVRASELIDSRRRFTEAVLSSASAGIIGVDGDGNIAIINRSGEKLIGHPESEVLHRPLIENVPELADMMTEAREGVQRLVQGQVTISRNNRERNLSVRVTAEQTGHAKDSFIITLDDITDLVAAQRTSAWGDVARRIAHEIKNPLTPIQLSAERIKRRYGKLIPEDDRVFNQCTDTIVRQVEDIRRMVDEFSRFARMPKPVIAGEDVADAVRQVVFLMRVGYPDIDIEVDIKNDPMHAQFYRRLISQALTNIIKNATEAISAVPPEELGRGRIDVTAAQEDDDIVIDVVDNGIGLPKESRSRLLEPYVTTREKGTGLGLAIVGRVLEDHGGRIELNDASAVKPGARGAWMRLRFAVSGGAGAAGQSEVKQTVPHGA